MIKPCASKTNSLGITGLCLYRTHALWLCRLCCNTEGKDNTREKCLHCVLNCARRELKFLHVVPVQSSEEQELSKIRELRRALADKRRLAEVSRVKALAAPARSTAVRSPAPLTEPEGFHFVTDERLKTHGMETRQDTDQYKETCFSSDLRHYAPLVRNVCQTKLYWLSSTWDTSFIVLLYIIYLVLYADCIVKKWPVSW